MLIFDCEWRILFLLVPKEVFMKVSTGLRSRKFLGRVGGLRMLGVGVELSRRQGVGVGFFCPTPTPETQLFYF